MFREDNVDTVGLREKIDYKKNMKSLNGEEIFFFSSLICGTRSTKKMRQTDEI